MAKVNWHYPREEFAEVVYKYLALGPIQAVKLFGPRRYGKTEFMTEDLAPLIEQRGHSVVYVDLWQRGEDCFAALLLALDQAVREKPLMERLKLGISEIAPKFRLKVPGLSTEIEVDTASLKQEIPSGLLVLMEGYCEKLADRERPAFLLLDEFQEITKTPYADRFIAALRSCLSKRRYSMVALFAGSSQDELIRMFSDRTAPFFAFAEDLDLPLLTEEFVDHQLDQFRSVARVNVDRNDALEIFRRFNENPMIVQRWLMLQAVYPNLSKEEAVLKVLSDVAEALKFGKTWNEFSSMERIVARLLANGFPIFGEEGMENFRNLTGRDEYSVDEIKVAIERLYLLGVAERNNGDWVIGDNILESWIKQRPMYEFRSQTQA